MTSIVTFTINPALDKSTNVDHVVPEDKLRCAAPTWQAGGGGINVARVCNRLGNPPLALFTCGGPQGTMLRGLLDKEGLNQAPISISGLTRESFSVRELESNQQYRFNVPGPELSKNEWEACLNAIFQLDPTPEYLALSGGLPPGVPHDFYGRIAKNIDQDRCRIILDTHHEPLHHAVNAGVFMLKPNIRELRQLTGLTLESEQQQKEVLCEIINKGGAQYIVLSLGAAGAVFADKNGTTNLRAPTVKIRSKVGAGDSMVGGIVWSLSQGYQPIDAARMGVAAGAAAVKSPGTELSSRADTLELYNQM